MKYIVTLNMIPRYIKSISPARGHAGHEKSISLSDCKNIRADMLGIGRNGLLIEMFHASRRLESIISKRQKEE